MAKIRVFISSTFYDLEQIREDLEKFIENFGYEPVLSEKGDIPYGKEEELEEYCYKEIENCDIIVALIGGRFGSLSKYKERSITQIEIETSLKLKKQVYVFINKDVLSEFKTYLINKGNPKINYNYVDDVKIFEFIDKIYSLKKNNPIFPFDTAKDIKKVLTKQWAGLFQSFLRKQIEDDNKTNIIEVTKPIIEEETSSYPFMNGEFLHSITWHPSEGNEKYIKTDIDGDGVKETIIIGRHAPIGAKLRVVIGKDVFSLEYDIKGLDENNEFNGTCQLAIKDVTNDGYPDILLCFSSGIEGANLNIWKFNKEKYLNTPRGKNLNPFEFIGYIGGQMEFRILNGGRIEVPYGGHGLYETYIWSGKKFIPAFEEELFEIFKDFIEAVNKNNEYSFFSNETKTLIGTEEEYKKNDKSNLYSKIREDFKNWENFHTNGIEFVKNTIILSIVGDRIIKGKKKKNETIDLRFIEENSKWKIEFDDFLKRQIR